VLRERESQFSRESGLEARDGCAWNIVDFTALGAHGVMMMLDRAIQIRGLSVRLRLGRRGPDIPQDVERAIHGGETDGGGSGFPSLHGVVQLPRGRITAEPGECFDDRAARLGRAIAVSGKTRVERIELRRAI
jgi:hypothetical protein